MKGFLIIVGAVLTGMALLIGGMAVGVGLSNKEGVAVLEKTRHESLAAIDECLISLRKAAAIIKGR